MNSSVGALVVDVREELGDDGAFSASSWLLVVLAASVPKSAAFQAFATRGEVVGVTWACFGYMVIRIRDLEFNRRGEIE